MDRQLDEIGNGILLPGGRERYRKALRLNTRAHAAHLSLYGY